MNIQILFISVFFAIVETGYFGWNIGPESDAEIICDGITMLLLAMAFKK